MFDNKKKKEEKNFWIAYIIPVLVVLSLLNGYLFMAEMKTLNNTYADMNDIEFLSSSTQRLISLAITNQLVQKDIFFIGTTTEAALSTNSADSISVLDKPEMIELADTVYESWLVIEEVIQQDDFDQSSLVIYR